MIQLKDDTTGAATHMSYDGRNFLTQARQDITTCCSPVLTQPVYDSEGVVRGRSIKNVLAGTISKDTKVLYFSGRPVALLETTTSPATLSYLSADHLGTPILETRSGGVSLWGGGFEPFGRDWNGAQAAGEFLRFPGQWEDEAWDGMSRYYNLYRWYEPQTGRYASVDPISDPQRVNIFSYAHQNPLSIIDPLGLKGVIGICCEPLASPFSFWRHCYIRRRDLETGRTTTIGLHTDQTTSNFIRATWDGTLGIIAEDVLFDLRGNEKNCYWDADPCDEKWDCVKRNEQEGYPRVSRYNTLGPNSNTFASVVAERCGLNTPPEANPRRAPGWGDPMPDPPTFYYPGPP